MKGLAQRLKKEVESKAKEILTQVKRKIETSRLSLTVDDPTAKEDASKDQEQEESEATLQGLTQNATQAFQDRFVDMFGDRRFKMLGGSKQHQKQLQAFTQQTQSKLAHPPKTEMQAATEKKEIDFKELSAQDQEKIKKKIASLFK